MDVPLTGSHNYRQRSYALQRTTTLYKARTPHIGLTVPVSLKNAVARDMPYNAPQRPLARSMPVLVLPYRIPL